jgi:hypothetical protein
MSCDGYCFTPGSRGPEQGPAVPGGSGGEVRRIDDGGTGTTATTGGGGAPRAAEVNLGKQQSQLLCSWTWTEKNDRLYPGQFPRYVLHQARIEISWDQFARSQLARVEY